jgi:uncharacterized protein (DUF58 family)
MRPAPLLIRLVAVIAVSALLVPLYYPLLYAAGGALALVLVTAVVEALLLRRVRFTAERQAKLALPLDERESTEVLITTSSTAKLRLVVRQRWPKLVSPQSVMLQAVIRPGEVLPLTMPVRAIARGTEAIEPVWVGATRWGLVERLTAAGGAGTLYVIPNLRAVKRLHKQLNAFALRSLGARNSPRIGKGREFDRLRDYVRDDDYRDIAWKASARHGRLIVREFRTERSQDVMIVLDQGHRMAARVEQITRLDHAINAAVLLSYICNRMEDKVGLVSFDTEVDKGIIAGRGAAHLRAVTSYVSGLEAEYRHTDYLAMAASLRRRLHHRTLILIMTVLPEREERHDLLRAVDMLTGQHLPLFITLSDRDLRAAAQLLPSDRTELSRTLVARDLWLGRVELMRELRARGALVVDSTAEDAGVDGVNAYIDVKRRQLL